MLIGSILEIQKWLPVGVANDFNRLKPHLVNAETAYVKPLLDTEMFEALSEFYTNHPYEDPTPAQLIWEQLLFKCQQAIIMLAYNIGFDMMNVQISDMGFTRVESTTSKGLFKYQENNLRTYFRNNGFNLLDEVLIYLEENADTFPKWKTGSAYTVFKQSFIPTAAVFNEIYFINKSRLTFLRLQQYFRFIEDTVIKPLLGAATYNQIKGDMTEDVLPSKVAEIVPYIRNPLAFFSVALLMEETGADLTDKGLYFEIINDGHIIAPAEVNRIAALVTRARSMGNGYLEALKTFLAGHLSDWPDYTPATPGAPFTRDNTGKKTFWG